jgi:hypothetical protein
MGSDLNSLNTFTKETSSNKVKLPKVGSNVIGPTRGKKSATIERTRTKQKNDKTKAYV